MNKDRILGIDAGSVSLKMTYKQNGQTSHFRKEHHGDPVVVFEEMLNHLDFNPDGTNSLLSGKYADILARKYHLRIIPSISCLLSTLESSHSEDVRYYVDIGSSGLSVVEIHNGKFQGYQTNSLCAAGTGAFLDQQMIRMGLDYQQIQNIPIIESPPSIATRCSVFAKSDLIHRQQQGYSIEQLWNGLVKGLAESAFSTLFRGKTIQHDVFLVGGLANNKIFLHFFSKFLNNNNLIVAPQPDYFWTQSLINYQLLNNSQELSNGKKEIVHTATFEKELSFKDDNPKTHSHYVDNLGTEVDIWNLAEGKHYEIFAGLDIGSTSTKVALTDKSGSVLAGLYTRTMGNPIEAFKNILKGIICLEKRHGVKFSFMGLGTTGSGRNLLAHFAGADLVKNEITSHLKGALKEFPDVNTIFEIGGQDSKYILVENSWMKDANMNYVCAAGTGSFLEEQAKNLNIALDDIPEICRGAKPPISSDRCTVFMEQDGNQLLAKGYSKSQVMSSILYSVCKNYLNRVVHNRPIQEPILFLGATAKNRGLVEAFENVLGKKVNTSQYSHLMGAIGVAELLRNDPPEKTLFKGLELNNQPVTLNEKVCTLCQNKCRITYMQSGNSKNSTSWGYMCGKEPEDKMVKPNNRLQAIKQLEKVINNRQIPAAPQALVYFPRGLQYFTFNPFWQHFFGHLNISLQPGPTSNEQILSYARSYSLTDFCFPLKMAVGHVMYSMVHQNGHVFVPFHIQDTANPKADNSYFCPLSQALPSIVKSTLAHNDLPSERLLSPVIDFSKGAEYNIDQLENSIGKALGLSKKNIANAFLAAREIEKELKQGLREYGEKFINGRIIKNKPTFVILGRGYNILDNTLNLGIITSIARQGYEVLPMEMLPVKREDISGEYHDMYWSYGQKVVAAAKYIAEIKGLYPVFLTNFSCGPDSFLLSTYEQILKGKPSLILELDEHGGDAGYLTRLESYFDRVNHHYLKGINPPICKTPEKRIITSIAGNKIYIPPMHPFGARLISAGLRAIGIEAVALVKEDNETFTLGKSHVRGSECMPAASTIGSFLFQIAKEKENGSISRALFMPCTNGPCRFGQYARLHDQILRKLDVDAKIISPNSDDDYKDIKGNVRIQMLKGIILADLMLKLGCRVRPYEKQDGQVDNIIEETMVALEIQLEKKGNITRILKELNTKMKKVPLTDDRKPLVGIVGEIYVRNSPFSNANLIRNIEASGGEAWLAPMMEWLHYTADIKKCRTFSDYIDKAISTGLTHYLERKYYKIFTYFLSQRKEPPVKEVIQHGRRHLPPEVEGESILTIGRAIGFINQGASLVVNVAPFGCMPGSISSSILKTVSRDYSTPIVSVFYDGETDFSNIVNTYISNVE